MTTRLLLFDPPPSGAGPGELADGGAGVAAVAPGAGGGGGRETNVVARLAKGPDAEGLCPPPLARSGFAGGVTGLAGAFPMVFAAFTGAGRGGGELAGRGDRP
ncbi:hypothetical protein LZC95_17990 [Pendulispora brunnea]|uniref:Uncharacterized protein n=1 Tax=Pendulispora brunnea TaxID=2905690 RepID=A0ABZ2KJJ6_9BACT